MKRSASTAPHALFCAPVARHAAEKNSPSTAAAAAAPAAVVSLSPCIPKQVQAEVYTPPRKMARIEDPDSSRVYASVFSESPCIPKQLQAEVYTPPQKMARIEESDSSRVYASVLSQPTAARSLVLSQRTLSSADGLSSIHSAADGALSMQSRSVVLSTSSNRDGNDDEAGLAAESVQPSQWLHGKRERNEMDVHSPLNSLCTADAVVHGASSFLLTPLEVRVREAETAPSFYGALVGRAQVLAWLRAIPAEPEALPDSEGEPDSRECGERSGQSESSAPSLPTSDQNSSACTSHSAVVLGRAGNSSPLSSAVLVTPVRRRIDKPCCASLDWPCLRCRLRMAFEEGSEDSFASSGVTWASSQRSTDCCEKSPDWPGSCTSSSCEE